LLEVLQQLLLVLFLRLQQPPLPATALQLQLFVVMEGEVHCSAKREIFDAVFFLLKPVPTLERQLIPLPAKRQLILLPAKSRSELLPKLLSPTAGAQAPSDALILVFASRVLHAIV
jgi:hypothetical protein